MFSKMYYKIKMVHLKINNILSIIKLPFREFYNISNTDVFSVSYDLRLLDLIFLSSCCWQFFAFPRN